MQLKNPFLFSILLSAVVISYAAIKIDNMNKKIIQTEQAPSPIGPYNQAVMANGTLYMSGQIALNPATGELVNADIISETKQVMINLKAVLLAADMEFKHVVKTTIYLKDMEDYAKVNEVYGSYFDDTTAPAREAVQVSRLPKDVAVEISMIAVED